MSDITPPAYHLNQALPDESTRLGGFTADDLQQRAQAKKFQEMLPELEAKLEAAKAQEAAQVREKADAAEARLVGIETRLANIEGMLWGIEEAGGALSERLAAVERQLSYPTGQVVAKCSCGTELRLPDGAGTPEEHGWGEISCEPGLKCVRCGNAFAAAMEYQEQDDLRVYGPLVDEDDLWDDEDDTELDWTDETEVQS